MSDEKPVIELAPQTFSRRGQVATMPQASAAPGALLQAITTIASDPAVDIEKIERLFSMHERLEKIQAEKAFNDAMSRAQSAIVPIARNRRNEHTRSNYADLAAINAIIVPIYTAEGLSVTFDTETKNENDPIPPGSVRTVAIVGHSGGFSRRYHIDLLPDDAGSQGKVNKTKVQAAGSTNLYGRRYLAAMIFNIATTDDQNDADGNGGKDGDKGTDKGEEARKEKEPGQLPTYTPEQVTAQLPAWRKLIADGARTADDIINALQTRYTISEDQIKRISTALKPTQGEIE